MLPLLLLLACRPPTHPVVPRDTGGKHPPTESGTDAPVDTGTPPVEIPGHVPGDGVFTDDAVHTWVLTLDDDAWNGLLANPTTWVEAAFTDGAQALQVGVRLKGYSSFQPLTGKPNFKVSFDHTVEGQRYDDLEAVDLVSEVEDPAFMSEALAYRVFRAGGQPASRTGFAWLTLNDQPYGLYTVVEKKDDVLLGQWWPDDAEGSLYESSSEYWPCDLDDRGVPRCDCWEVDEEGSVDTRMDLVALCALATDTPDATWYDAIQGAVDWTEVSRHMAMEMTLDAHDHYAGYMGNVYLYHAPVAGTWSLVPASMNSLFGSARYAPGSCGSAGTTLADYDAGLLARRCWDDETCAADELEAVRWAAGTLAASDVLAHVDAWEVLLEPFVQADPKAGYTVDDFHLQVGCIRNWLAARPAALARELPAQCLGEAGDLVVEGWGDLSTNGLCDREGPDAPAYRVAALAGARVDVGAAPDGIVSGDEVILAVLQGVPGDHHAVGAFAFAQVRTTDTTGLDLDAAPALEPGLDLAAWKVVVQRVPHYASVVVRSGGVLTTAAWTGQTGGLLAFRVTGTLTVEAGGQVSARGLGYAGGAMGASYNVDGWQGESLEGAGIGGATSGAGYNEANGAWAANQGGGGCNVGGGGGEHAGGATGSVSWNGSATAPQPGQVYGDPSALVLGSGGGGVVNLGGSSGPGGAGGGILYVDAESIVAPGAGALTASGEDATRWASGTWSYGAGGGAGGSVWLVAGTLDLGEGAVTATGGRGYADVTRPGGDGGTGAIRVRCDDVNGSPCSDATMGGLTEPAATVE